MAQPKPLPDLAKTGFEFLKAELATCNTLSDIALETDHPDKRQRNRKNARLAYDTVVRNQPRVLLTEEQTHYVSRTLLNLRKKLEQLGEPFPD